jgi:hypothetical protein
LEKKPYFYRNPKFEHTITVSLKKKSKIEGCFSGHRELKYVEGEYIAAPVPTAQMRMKDYIEK